MRRDRWALLVPLALLAMLSLGAWLALAALSAPTNLIPADVALVQSARSGFGRQDLLARLAPRQTRFDLHRHLISHGWRLRADTFARQEGVRTYTRRSLGGHIFETVVLTSEAGGRRLVRMRYFGCVMHVTCSWR
jgi:hypothetical protein